MTGDNPKSIQHLINALELRLREIGLWAEVRPSSEALSSTMPFCYDTLELEAWLQFVFIGRMRELIEQGDPLPNSCGITPYIDMLRTTGRSVDPQVVEVIKEIDDALTV